MKKLLFWLLAVTLCSIGVAHSAGSSAAGDPELNEALLDAAKSGNVELSRQLLERGANPDAITQEGYTPLHVAAMLGRVDVCRLLLDEYGANPSVRGPFGNTPLHTAASEGHSDACGQLLERGANPNIQDRWGYTPLHEAASEGHSDACGQLLERGANPNIQNRNNASPLHGAVWRGHVEVCELLLEHGADPSLKNNDGATPLHKALSKARSADAERRARYIEIAELIVNDNKFDFGFVLGLENERGQTPLDIAQGIGLPEDLLNKLEPVPMKHS